MKKLLPLLLILMSGTAAHASMSTRHQTSLQLSVDAARSITSRTANSYSIAGSGVTLDVGGGGSADNLVGGFKTIASGAVTEWNIPTATTTANGSFSFSNSFTTGDASTATGTNVTAYTAGAAGTAAPGTITNAHAVVLAGGTVGSGSGSTVTGQFVSEVTIFD
jgi:hypothetical protein|tara:strand:+ start:185 stop:676 length:492 start_codon:yes stop_codon:yes gene_type:complete